MSPRSLRVEEVRAIHDLQLVRFGGRPGLRDQGMLESAVGKPQNRWAYEGGSFATLAASLAFGLARNHPFTDGNKRTAFVSAYTFLRLNGYDFVASEADVVLMFVALAGGEIEENGLAKWFGVHSIESP